MYLRRSIHRHPPLLAKDVQVHRLQQIPEPSIQTHKSNQGTFPTEVPKGYQAQYQRCDEPSWPIAIDRFEILQRLLLLLGNRIAYCANPFAVITAILIPTLQNRIVGIQVGPAMVAEKTSALGAMVSILVHFASADRALGGVAKPGQFQLGSYLGSLLVLDARIDWGWVAHRFNSCIVSGFTVRFDSATLTRILRNSIDQP